MQLLKELKESVIEPADRKVSEQIKRRREAPKKEDTPRRPKDGFVVQLG